MKAEFIVTIAPEIMALHSRGDIARALSATVRRLRWIGKTLQEPEPPKEETKNPTR